MTKTLYVALMQWLKGFCGLTEGAGGSDDPDAFGSGMEQLAGALGGRGAGGHHVIHQKNVAALDHRARGDLEGSANLLATLLGGEGDLRVGKAHAKESRGLQLEGAANVAGHFALGAAGDELRLIEAARTKANLVHRHGDEQEGFGVDIAFQLQGGLGR